MLQLIIGILLILTPFLLVHKFNNKIVGFSAILAGTVLFHLAIAFITQGLHVFHYPVLASLHGIVAAFSIFFFVKSDSFPVKININKEHLIFIFALILIFFQFYSVHFNYSGEVSSSVGTHYVYNDSYTYPSFSDEWIAVYAVNKSIDTNSLPWNDFFFGKPDHNFLVAFHSLIAEITLLMGLNVLTQYAYIVIVFGLISVISIFLVLRSLGVSIMVATITMLLVPYVTSGSNLPMLWYLLPWNVGFIIFLLSVVFMVRGRQWLAVVSSLLATVLYPPILLFTATSILIYLLKGGMEDKEVNRKKMIGTYIAIMSLITVSFIVISALLSKIPLIEIAGTSFDLIIRPLNNAFHVNPNLSIWYIVPMIALPFSFYAIWIARKQITYFVVPALIGLALWLIYSFSNFTFLVDFHRVAAMTSLMLMIFAGIGLQASYVWAKDNYPKIFNYNTSVIFVALALIIFLLLSSSYTSRENWRKLTTPVFINKGKMTVVHPAPPSNRYYQEDDFTIFSKIDGQRFLSPGWKGLIIGAVTNNKPLFTKPSTQTLVYVSYDLFMKSSCSEKEEIASTKNIPYVYTNEQLNCDRFIKVDESSEGFVLYKFHPRKTDI